jgi:glycosyltransferase A (GT-A) superfamily protein (DUF2064 family)
MFNKTAIILFANLPEFEARAKSLSAFSSQKATRQISTVLTQHFYQLAEKSTADAFLIDSYLQKGKSFANRITNAFTDIYSKGYENVICIGNDCPSLTLTHLQAAIEQLETGKVVLGPTKDGGAYLIGIPKKYFNAASFSQIKWQSNKTYQGLKYLYRTTKASVLETETLTDIDKPEDILKEINKTSFIKLLAQLVLNFADNFTNKTFQLKLNYNQVDSSSLKSPPAFSI